MKKRVDKWFLGIIVVLSTTGVLVFLSAALSILTKEEAVFSSIVLSQFLGIFIGIILATIIIKLPYKLLRHYSFYIFAFSILLTALVFIPQIGFQHGGATRWLSFGSYSVQPAEFLKLGFVLYFAAWLSSFRKHLTSVTYGLLPFIVMIGIVALILLKQPDTGTFFVIFITGLAMFVVSGAPWKQSLVVGGFAVASIGVLAAVRPYVKERLLTFLNPAMDPLGAGYQIKQSLIAVGSGEMFGRGFGQSIQKFNFLPEPISDSIFAVFAEEFGFVGSVFLLSLFAALAIRGFILALRAPDHFSGLVIFGIVILITGQAFLNIGSMLGIFPLTGLPLPFVSHGGSAMIATFMGVGVVLSMSKYCRKK
jgi:cell division protein FtsW